MSLRIERHDKNSNVLESGNMERNIIEQGYNKHWHAETSMANSKTLQNTTPRQWFTI